MNGDNVGIILAGGTGTRYKSEVPKQYTLVNGKELITYSIESFRKSRELNHFFLVIGENDYGKYEEIEEKYGVKCIKGGQTRNESIFNAINYVKNAIQGCKKILFHEAARPFIKSEIIDEYFRALDSCDAIITASEITDSIGMVEGGVVDRNQYYLIQAPEAFHFDLLSDNFTPESTITATVQQLPSNIKLKKYFDFKINYKVTYPEDLFIIEQLLKTI